MMITPRVVIGYHGCDEKEARLALEGGLLRGSTNAYDWLGHGVYFWEDSPARAMRWAQDAARRENSRVKTPAVLGAVLDLKSCLNLTDPESIGLVQLAHTDFMILCAKDKVKLPQNKGVHLGARYLDCAVMQHLHTLYEKDDRSPFDSIRAFFTEGEPAYENAGFRILDHVQICIRNPRCILGYFRPLFLD
ncbi:MAG: hypothetical protein JWM59_4113 [Verrucomicrobiales bacterium]|nr:hypothetical protein [Verrucomicrobiales bacterium]